MCRSRKYSVGKMMQKFVSEIKTHLEQKLIPFWENLKDETWGGYEKKYNPYMCM